MSKITSFFSPVSKGCQKLKKCSIFTFFCCVLYTGLTGNKFQTPSSGFGINVGGGMGTSLGGGGGGIGSGLGNLGGVGSGLGMGTSTGVFSAGTTQGED